ncbi:hypothetical protein A2U01_0075962, partial [Trifolium medium]|nr:hypothetical protein [Trifolium medium]
WRVPDDEMVELSVPDTDMKSLYSIMRSSRKEPVPVVHAEEQQAV